MEINPYTAPQSNLAVQPQEEAQFHVVATRKYWFLLILTLGLYEIYWFYCNWRLYKEQVDSNVWPVPRAIFSVFFAHSLNRIVDERLKRQQLSHDWSPGLCATIFVVFSLMATVTERLSAKEIGAPLTDVMPLIVLPISGWALWQTQRAINVVCGDPDGDSNSEFTWANYVWMLLGGLLWAVAIWGIYVLLTE
jgi:hypothetical protein